MKEARSATVKKLLLALVLAGSPALANTFVNDALNAADGLFNVGEDGCIMVTQAILAANNPDVYGGSISSSQRREVAEYAARCGLRF